MIRYGVVGTNWITQAFIDAATETGQYHLQAVYSRSLKKAQAFSAQVANHQPQGVDGYADFEAFVADEQLDLIYIASPNSLHFQQAKAALLAGKHVVIEKPAAANPAEWQILTAIAAQQERYIIEAARHLYEENFQKVQNWLQENPQIIGANLTFMKYSSRYDAVLAGEEPNVFSLKYAGGALQDLGIYPVYAALAWFGRPDSQQYFCRKIATGVDGSGTILLRYEAFDVTIMTGKISDSFLPSEIYTTEATLQMDAVNSIGTIQILRRGQNAPEVLADAGEKVPMQSEAETFSRWLLSGKTPQANADYQKSLTLTAQVHEVLYALRKSAEIEFPADEKM